MRPTQELLRNSIKRVPLDDFGKSRVHIEREPDVKESSALHRAALVPLMFSAAADDVR